jgi:hypothetical protein
MSKRKILKKLCKKYFDTWSRKDLDGLAAMFANDVLLQDWEISASGIFKVLEANKAIFDKVTSLKVEVSNMYHDKDLDHRVVCCLFITINEGTKNEEMIRVIDVIGFDQDNKINFIDAFKG